MTPAALNGLLDHAGYFVALVIFQLWNMYKHGENKQRIETNRNLVDTGYAALHADFVETKLAVAAANEALARMSLVIQVGERRVGDRRGAAPQTISPDAAATAQANGFGQQQKWTDPRTPRPPEGAT